jgi:hypothetical protein
LTEGGFLPCLTLTTFSSQSQPYVLTRVSSFTENGTDYKDVGGGECSNNPQQLSPSLEALMLLNVGGFTLNFRIKVQD